VIEIVWSKMAEEEFAGTTWTCREPDFTEM
jgi:hypothetical protein